MKNRLMNLLHSVSIRKIRSRNSMESHLSYPTSNPIIIMNNQYIQIVMGQVKVARSIKIHKTSYLLLLAVCQLRQELGT